MKIRPGSHGKLYGIQKVNANSCGMGILTKILAPWQPIADPTAHRPFSEPSRRKREHGYLCCWETSIQSPWGIFHLRDGWVSVKSCRIPENLDG